MKITKEMFNELKQEVGNFIVIEEVTDTEAIGVYEFIKFLARYTDEYKELMDRIDKHKEEIAKLKSKIDDVCDMNIIDRWGNRNEDKNSRSQEGQ